MITCTKCKIEKPIASFYLDRHKKNGRKSWCASCSVEYSKAYTELNPLTVSIMNRRINRELRAKAIKLLGGKCVICGIDDMDMLDIDHKFGGGLEMRKRRKSGSIQWYRRIIYGENKEGELQILCGNHHHIKTRNPERFKELL